MKVDAHKLFSKNYRNNFFNYSKEEVSEFSKAIDPNQLKYIHETISRGLQISPHVSKLHNIIDYIKTLTPSDLDLFETHIHKFTDENPNMLWNMISGTDKHFYKTPDKFYEWLSTISDDTLNNFIMRAADGKKLHPDYMYKKGSATKVEVLDGYITISSSNLQALEKFRDRVLESNDCSYEHRIKKHDGVEIHSYVFNMNKN